MNLSFALSGLLLLALPFWILGQCATPSDTSSGMIAHWKLNGYADDASGNGNNGVANGMTLTSGLCARPNAAYESDGSGVDQYILVSDGSPVLNLVGTSYTIAAWINSDTLATMALSSRSVSKPA